MCCFGSVQHYESITDKLFFLVEQKKNNHYKVSMLSNPMQVRFSAEADRRLGAVAEANGLTKAEVIRICVDNFLADLERSGEIPVTMVVKDPGTSQKTKPQGKPRKTA